MIDENENKNKNKRLSNCDTVILGEIANSEWKYWNFLDAVSDYYLIGIQAYFTSDIFFYKMDTKYRKFNGELYSYSFSHNI